MFKKRIGFCALVLVVSTAWAEEPSRKQPVKQRVDPKLLREAIALPEYQGKAPDSSTLLLEDLQRLSDQLKKNGDGEAADLLQRFIVEHQRLLTQLPRHSASINERLVLHVKPIEVKLDDLSSDSLLRSDCTLLPNRTPAETFKQMEAELDRLVATKKARLKTEPVMKVRSDDAIHHHSVAEVPVMVGSGPVNVELREFGTTIEVTPTVLTKERVQVQTTRDATFHGTESTLAPQKLVSQFELNVGESVIQSSSDPLRKGHKLFVIYKLVPRS